MESTNLVLLQHTSILQRKKWRESSNTTRCLRLYFCSILLLGEMVSMVHLSC